MTSLMSILLSNPGFVTDYFMSEELTRSADNKRRFAVYKKADGEVRAADPETKDQIKPLVVCSVDEVGGDSIGLI